MPTLPIKKIASFAYYFVLLNATHSAHRAYSGPTKEIMALSSTEKNQIIFNTMAKGVCATTTLNCAIHACVHFPSYCLLCTSSTSCAMIGCGLGLGLAGEIIRKKEIEADKARQKRTR